MKRKERKTPKEKELKPKKKSCNIFSELRKPYRPIMTIYVLHSTGGAHPYWRAHSNPIDADTP